MIKVGFIGAGNRVKNFNLPALDALKEKYEVVGCVTRTGACNISDLKVYNSIESLANHVDLMVISVPAHSNIDPAQRVIKSKKPILIETPLGINMQHTKATFSILKQSSFPVGVLEQWPFLPIEMFKKQIIASGLIGDIAVVENDYRTYEYHGISQLRSYLPKGINPVDIKTQRSIFPSHDGKSDPWSIITVKYDNGSLLIYKYSDKYKRVNYSPKKELRIYGTSGTINGDCLWDPEFFEIRSLNEEYKMLCEHDSREIKALFFTPENGTKIEWKNPFVGYGLSEHQIAVALHYEKMYESLKYNVSPLYPIQDAFLDMAMMSQR